jgi:hypothetical protein
LQGSVFEMFKQKTPISDQNTLPAKNRWRCRFSSNIYRMENIKNLYCNQDDFCSRVQTLAVRTHLNDIKN